MHPKEAEKRQLKIYRRMPDAERLRIGLELGDLTMELARQNQRDRNLMALKLKNGRTKYDSVAFPNKAPA